MLHKKNETVKGRSGDTARFTPPRGPQSVTRKSVRKKAADFRLRQGYGGQAVNRREFVSQSFWRSAPNRVLAPTAQHSLGAWGNAPGLRKENLISAESAIHFHNAFSHHSCNAAVVRTHLINRE